MTFRIEHRPTHSHSHMHTTTRRSHSILGFFVANSPSPSLVFTSHVGRFRLLYFFCRVKNPQTAFPPSIAHTFEPATTLDWIPSARSSAPLACLETSRGTVNFCTPTRPHKTAHTRCIVCVCARVWATVCVRVCRCVFIAACRCGSIEVACARACLLASRVCVCASVCERVRTHTRIVFVCAHAHFGRADSLPATETQQLAKESPRRVDT